MKILHLKNSYIIKSIGILSIGSLFAQIIGFLGTIIITRLYTKETIGIVIVITSISGMFGGVINGKFDLAIIKERKEERIIPLILLSLYIGVIFSIIISIISSFYFKNQNLFSPIIATIYVFISLMLIALSNIFRCYNNNIEDYKIMSIVIIIRRLSEEVSMILFGIFKCGYIYLLISRAIGLCFGMRYQARHLFKYLKRILNCKIIEIINVFNIHKKQLYYSAPATLINSISYYILNIYIKELYNISRTAEYSISFTCLGVPLSILSTNISKVYFAEASKEFELTGNFIQITKRIIAILLVSSIVLFIFIYFITPIIIPIMLSVEYSNACNYIKILSPMFITRFFTSSLITGLIVAEKQNIDLYLESLFFISSLLIFILSKKYQLNIYTFLSCVSAAYTFVYILFLILIVKYSKINYKSKH